MRLGGHKEAKAEAGPGGERNPGREEPAIHTHPGRSPRKLRKKAKLFKLRA